MRGRQENRLAGARRVGRRAWLASIAGAVGVVLLLGASPGQALAQRGAATTVIVVRHAEKEARPAADPPLTAAGKARAEALWTALQDAGVRAVITTQYARTVQTAAPTAAHLGITPEVVSASGADHPARVAAVVRKHAGETVLVVGHSNTVPAIIAALGAKEPAAICDEAYDNFYVVTIDAAGKASLIHSRYGVATPVGPSCGTMKMK
jgi:broad specificity phosphatase PhoE